MKERSKRGRKGNRKEPWKERGKEGERGRGSGGRKGEWEGGIEERQRNQEGRMNE